MKHNAWQILLAQFTFLFILRVWKLFFLNMLYTSINTVSLIFWIYFITIWHPTTDLRVYQHDAGFSLLTEVENLHEPLLQSCPITNGTSSVLTIGIFSSSSLSLLFLELLRALFFVWCLSLGSATCVNLGLLCILSIITLCVWYWLLVYLFVWLVSLNIIFVFLLLKLGCATAQSIYVPYI